MVSSLIDHSLMMDLAVGDGQMVKLVMILLVVVQYGLVQDNVILAKVLMLANFVSNLTLIQVIIKQIGLLMQDTHLIHSIYMWEVPNILNKRKVLTQWPMDNIHM